MGICMGNWMDLVCGGESPSTVALRREIVIEEVNFYWV